MSILHPFTIFKWFTLCGQTILRQLLQDVHASDNFALIVDEATDISHYEQMCIAIRWVNSSYNIHEASLGLVQLPDTKAQTLFTFIKDVLMRCSLPIASCIGQAYDGAANYEWCAEWGPGSYEESSRSLSLCPLLCP